MKWVIDNAIPRGHPGLLLLAGGAFVLAYSSRLLLDVQGVKFGTQATERLAVRLRFRLLRHLQCQSSAYFENASPGEIVFRLEQDVEQIGRSGEEVFTSSFQSSIFLVLNLTAMFLLNAKLAVVVLPVIPIFAFVRYRYRHQANMLSVSVQKTSAARSAFFQEQIPAITQLQLLCSEPVQARRFLSVARHAMSTQLTRRRMEMLYLGLLLLVMGFAIGVMLTCGGYQVMNGILTVGGLVAFWGYLMRLFEPIAGLIELDIKLQRIRASVHRVRDVLEAPTTVKNPVPAIKLASLRPATVQFVNVSFTYDDGRVGVEALTFAVDAGEKVAIVGRTGSGKSTITKLIARLYDIQKGSIEVDGHDVRRLALSSLRSSVIVVPQEPILFEGNFRDNLMCGYFKSTSQEMADVIGATELDAVLRALPGGWSEQLGPRANRLSGGERQRLALARALLRKPRMLVLDESTSALDGLTEERVLKNLAALAGQITLLSVSHNPVVMKWVDRIIVMGGGHLVDEGTHGELSLRSKVYQNICEDEGFAQSRLSAIGGRHQLASERTSTAVR
jgi:ABC-type bacteriocin/lantibiotic exporter with double-glycine peptidase domain